MKYLFSCKYLPINKKISLTLTLSIVIILMNIYELQNNVELELIFKTVSSLLFKGFLYTLISAELARLNTFFYISWLKSRVQTTFEGGPS